MSMVAGTINIKGERYVVIPETEYLGYVGHAQSLPSLMIAAHTLKGSSFNR